MNDEILSQFTYNPETGTIIGIRGRPVGHKDARGYIRIGVVGSYIRAHRLAWFLMTGSLPSGDIDHINRNPADNRWENLREATRSENASNSKIRSDNKHGIKGISWCTKDRIFLVQISLDGKRWVVGRYRDFFEACCARKSAENRLAVIF